MRQRTSIDKEQQTVILRKSPRLHPKFQQNSEDPKTPGIEPRANRVTNPEFSPLSSHRLKPSNKQQREVSRKARGKCTGSTVSTSSSTGSRRSSRLTCLTEVSKNNASIISSNSSTGSRRSSRLKCLTEVSKTEASILYSNSSTGCRRSSRLKCLTEVPKSNVSVVSSNSSNRSRRSSKSYQNNSQVESVTPLRRSLRLAGNDNIQKCSIDNVEKKVTMGSIRDSRVGKEHKPVALSRMALKNSDSSLDPVRAKAKMVDLEERAARSSCQSQSAKLSLEVENGEGDKRKENVDLEEKKRGVKRKKVHGEDGHPIAKGWTKEQELALERAYFAAKATPHFWKKVAKMVPGKSSQECFDRIHLDHVTPPQPRPRARTKKTVSSLMSPPSASKLLQPADAKPNRHISQKTVREMLNKQYMVERDSKGIDVFSLLEESTTTTTTTKDLPNCGTNLVTPELKLGHLSNFSRLSNLTGATLFSPPVLKPIKNKAFHDRYIDQLHCRDAKRKAALLRTSKLNQGKNEEHQKVNRTAAIQAAKNALIFDARDAIKQFRNSQTNPFQNIFCGMEDDDDDDDDIGDDCGYNGDDD